MKVAAQQPSPWLREIRGPVGKGELHQGVCLLVSGDMAWLGTTIVDVEKNMGPRTHGDQWGMEMDPLPLGADQACEWSTHFFHEQAHLGLFFIKREEAHTSVSQWHATLFMF